MKTFADFQIDVHGKSGRVYTTCPQCSSQRKKKKAPCLAVDVEEGLWICNHCGWAGGLGQGEKRFDAAWRKPQYRKPDPPPVKPIDPILAWFDERQISPEVVMRNRIHGTTVYMPQVEDFVGAIAFPYYRGDELVNVKYRDREKNFRMEAGAELLRRREWRKANRERLREYLRDYRRKNHATLELKRKAKAAGVAL